MQLQGTLGKLDLNILKRSNPNASDFWDSNWLETEIMVNVQGFSAIYEANLRVEELQSFYKDLNNLQQGIKNEAEFSTIEEGLYLYCRKNINGSVECKGKAMSETGNNLDFKLETDLASLDRFISELHSILDLYPIIGNPDR